MSLPDRVNKPGEKPRFKCFICSEEKGIFEGDFYETGSTIHHFVCWGCMRVAVRTALYRQQALNSMEGSHVKHKANL